MRIQTVDSGTKVTKTYSLRGQNVTVLNNVSIQMMLLIGDWRGKRILFERVDAHSFPWSFIPP